MTNQFSSVSIITIQSVVGEPPTQLETLKLSLIVISIIELFESHQIMVNIFSIRSELFCKLFLEAILAVGSCNGGLENINSELFLTNQNRWLQIADYNIDGGTCQQNKKINYFSFTNNVNTIKSDKLHL